MYRLVRPAAGYSLTLLCIVLAAPLPVSAQTPATPRVSRLVQRSVPEARQYVINLSSMRRPPASGDAPTLPLVPGTRYSVEKTTIDGVSWYRLQMGPFATLDEANAAIEGVRARYPGAWVGRAASGATAVTTDTPAPARAPRDARADTPTAAVDLDALMARGRTAMMSGELSQAVQIYTKVLGQPESAQHPQAQELLALARQRNGQKAHAKAEYERYLALYPDADGATRVRQRLAALVAADVIPAPVAGAASPAGPRDNPWRVSSFLAQRYRRDENRFGGGDTVVSQSAVFSDFSVDARRRGERFDFDSRITGGYLHDLQDSSSSTSGSDVRLAYAYAGLTDTATGLSARLGRQTRNTGGVLGRFDGVNVAWELGERWELAAVAGRPVYSTRAGADDDRLFEGVSASMGLADDRLELGVFALRQTLDGMVDRQVVGSDLRYFSESLSVAGQIDYDTAFKALDSMFLQAAWRLDGGLTFSGVVDRRRSQRLGIGNAMMGQPVTSFDELAVLFTEEELRQLALDRAPEATTMTLGVSSPLTPRLQISANATSTDISASPDSGGVAGQPASSYRYLSTNLVASSLWKQGDVYIVALRAADSTTTRVQTVSLDSRWPLRRTLYFSPRLRVDYRTIKSDQSHEWIYTPGLRIHWRWGRHSRLDLEAGRQFATRTTSDGDIDRDASFIMLGYQLFY